MVVKWTAVLVSSIAFVAADAAPPANDNIANAATLTGLSATASVSNVEATQQPGDFSGRTVWWRWTAPVSGRVLIDTVNSAAKFLDLKVFLMETPGVPGGTVSFDEANTASETPSVSFAAAVGTTYLIGLGATTTSSSNWGLINLSLSLSTADPVGQLTFVGPATLANDNFANRITLTDATPSAMTYSQSGTRESGEYSQTGERTFWWTYRPTANGRLTIGSQGSSPNHKRVHVFLGEDLNQLRLIDSQSPGSSTDHINFSFPVTANTNYQICFGTSSSNVGSFVLTLSMNANADVSSLNIPHPATLVNDNFANRLTLSGETVGAIAYNLTATNEASEPTSSGNKTFWWTYRPAFNGWLTISSQGTDSFHKVVALYLGNSLASLKVANGQAPSSSSTHINLTIPVTANTDYQISFGAGGSAGGNLVMSLQLTPQLSGLPNLSGLNIPMPATNANDHFADRITVAGNAVTVIGYNLPATREALEPSAPNGGTREKTLWWSWQAPASGDVMLDFTGSDPSYYNSYGSATAWRGTSLSSLTNVIFKARPSAAQLVFEAVAGTMYHFATGSSNTSSGGNIIMTIYGAPSAPVFGEVSESRWITLGAGFTLTASADVAEGSYRWLKNGAAIAGATGSSLSLANAALTHAALYRVKAENSIGSTLSAGINVGVINQTSSGVAVTQGTTMTLTVVAAGPGPLDYRWLRNGVEMVDAKVGTQNISGTGTAKLSITMFDSNLADTYSCRVGMADPRNAGSRIRATSGNFVVSVRLKPAIPDLTVPLAAVGRAFSWPLSASENPTKFIVTGLPAGLSLNSQTGLISGVPTLAGPNKVRISAQNLVGTGAVREFSLPVDPLVQGLSGPYWALVERDQTLNSHLGGTLAVTVLSSGNLSGSLKLGSTTHPFTSRVTVPNSAGNPSCTVTILRPRLSSLTLLLNFQPETGRVFGSVSRDGQSVSFEGWVNRWSVTNKPLSRGGSYNSVLELPLMVEGERPVPRGRGFFQTTVNSTTGVTSVVGRSADGTAFTSSAVLWLTGEVPIHSLMQTNKASIMGSPEITVAGSAPTYLGNRVMGSLSLEKVGPAAVADRLYKAGYGPFRLNVNGSKWIKPALRTMLFDWADAPGNARVMFAEGGLESAAQAEDVSQDLQLTLTNTTKFATLTTGNPCGVSMILNVTTGLFSGSYKLTDPNPAGRGTLIRTVPYSGILIHHLQEGYGWFQLPGLPVPSAIPPVTSANSLIEVGNVWFGLPE